MATEIYGAYTVISDPGENANSYAAVSFYKSVLSGDPNKDISSETDESIAQRLINATSQIDFENFDNLQGEIYDTSFSLLFPRTGLTDYRGQSVSDFDIFPEQLKLATVYQAYHIGKVDYYAEDQGLPEVTVKRQKLEGVGEKEFFSASERGKATGKDKWGKEVDRYLKSFLISPLTGGSGWSVPVMSRG